MKKTMALAGYTITSQAVAVFSVLLVQIYLARSISLQEFGSLATAQAITATVESTIVSRGYEVSLNILGRYRDQPMNRLSLIYTEIRKKDILSCILGYFILLLIGFGSIPSSGQSGLFIVALASAIPCQVLYGYRRSIFILSNQIKSQSLFEINSSFLSLLIAILLIRIFGAWGFVLSIVFSAAIKNTLSHLYTKDLAFARDLSSSLIHSSFTSSNSTIAGELRSLTVHSLLRSLLSGASNNADVIFISIFSSQSIVGLYRVAKTLASMPAKISAPIWALTRPKLFETLRKNKRSSYIPLIIKHAFGLAILSVVMILASALMGPFLLNFFYGTKYDNSFAPMILLMVGSSFSLGITGWLGFVVIIASNKRLGTWLSLLNLLTIVIAALVLRPDSPVMMALCILLSSLFISAASWSCLFLGLFSTQSLSDL